MRQLRAIVAISALSLVISSCAAEGERAPFRIQITSTDVQANAFDDVEILIEPRMASESFTSMSEQVYFNGGVRTRIVGRSLLITVRGPYFRGGNQPMGAETIRVNFPVYAETELDSPTGSDPTVSVFFLKGGVRIAQGNSILPWPLVDGLTSPTIVVACDPASLDACAGQ